MTLKEITNFLDIALDIECESNIEISGLNTLQDANSFELTFLENKKYIKDLENTKSSCCLLKKEFLHMLPKNCIALVCEEPYLKLAYASKLFAPKVVEKKR